MSKTNMTKRIVWTLAIMVFTVAMVVAIIHCL